MEGIAESEPRKPTEESQEDVGHIAEDAGPIEQPRLGLTDDESRARREDTPRAEPEARSTERKANEPSEIDTSTPTSRASTNSSATTILLEAEAAESVPNAAGDSDTAKSTSPADTRTPASALPIEISTSASVPNELVEQARTLWTTDVTYKAARRYLGRLMVIGEPHATTDEIAHYLRCSARSARVQRARFPIAVACMPEEFADWLERYRRMRSTSGTRAPSGELRSSNAESARRVAAEALSGVELAKRAMEFCSRIGEPSGRARLAASAARNASAQQEKQR